MNAQDVKKESAKKQSPSREAKAPNAFRSEAAHTGSNYPPKGNILESDLKAESFISGYRPAL